MQDQAPDASSSSITITDLLITLPGGIGLSAFSLPGQPCQVLVSVTCHLLPHCLEPSPADKDGVVDDWDTLGLGKSVNYSALGKSLSRRLTEAGSGQEVGVRSLEDLLQVAVQHVAEEYPSSLHRVDVRIERKRALLFSEAVSVFGSVDLLYPSSISGSTANIPPNHTTLFTRAWSLKIHGIQADTIVGLNPHERLEKQRLELDVELDLLALFGKENKAEFGVGFDYKTFGRTAHEVSAARYNLLVTIRQHNLTR